MRRRVPPAPHGFDINSRGLFLLSLCVLFAARTPDTGHFCPREHNRRVVGKQPLTGSPRVLLLTTTAPSKVPWLALFRLRHTVGVEKILVNTSSIHCGFLLAASAPRSEYGKPVTFSVAQGQPPRLTCGANMEYHWIGYFRVADMKRMLLSWDEWMRRRFRMYIWKQWKKPKTKVANLRKLGIPGDKAYQWGNSRLGYWRIAGSPVLKCSITNERLAAAGYFSIFNYYESLHLCG